MRLVVCSECGKVHSPYSYDRRYDEKYLHYVESLDEILHPTCLNYPIWVCEQVYQMDMNPLRRILGFQDIGVKL